MGRYWCKGCEIFVDDNPIAKRHHESSGRHKSGILRTIEAVHRKNRDEQKKSGKREFIKRKEIKKDEDEQLPIPFKPKDITQREPVYRDAPTETVKDSIRAEQIMIKRTPKKQVSEAERETKRWNLDKKITIRLSDSDDESIDKPTVTFKKRKVTAVSRSTQR